MYSLTVYRTHTHRDCRQRSFILRGHFRRTLQGFSFAAVLELKASPKDRVMNLSDQKRRRARRLRGDHYHANVECVEAVAIGRQLGRRRTMKKIIMALMLLLASTAFSPNKADAQAGGYALQQIKESLSQYDLKNGSTLSVLRKLNEFINDVTVEREVRQARFMRAITLFNFVVIAYITENDDILLSAADIMKMERGALRPFVEKELNDCLKGLDRLSGQQAIAALTIIDKGFHPRSTEVKQTSAVLRELLMVDALSKSVEKGINLADMLKEYADDPCGNPKASCAAPISSFNAEGRKAIAALMEVGEAVKRLRSAALNGDPLARYFDRYLDEFSKKLNSIELRPAPKIAENLVSISEAGKTSRNIPDAIIVINRHGLQFGFVPKVALSESGGVTMIMAGEPALPAMTKVSLPASYLPYIRSIDKVTEVLKAALKTNEHVSVAIGPTKDIPAHVVARVLLSLRPLGITDVYMLGVDGDGSTNTVPLQFISPKEAEEMGPAQVNLRIRLGGYTLKIGVAKTDIPRVKGEEGFEFDVNTLAAKVRNQSYRTAEVSFMGNVSSESLVAGMFQVAPDKDPVRLIIPQ
jgi:hypothetical protein